MLAHRGEVSLVSGMVYSLSLAFQPLAPQAGTQDEVKQPEDRA
jgi:hypothetical protein